MADDLGMSFFERIRFGWGRNTVRILLDLDGVVAAEGALPEGSYTSFSGSGYATWRIRNTVLQWLAEKQQDERVELVWSTTWQQYANSIFEEIGLEPLEWISFDETYQRPDDWYKEDGLRLFIEENSDPIVLVDDELPDELLNHSNTRILSLKPRSLTGLTDEDLNRIDSFIDDYRARKIS